MGNRILFRNGRVVHPDHKAREDILVDGDRIVQVGEGLTSGRDTTVLDCSGRLIFPGVVDPHTHMGVPIKGGYSADDFESGSRAALHGGVTTIIDFSILDQGQTLEGSVQSRLSQAGKSLVDFGLHCNITRYSEELLREIPNLIEMGIVSFKVFTTYEEAGMMLTYDQIESVARVVGEQGGILMVHAEDDCVIQHASAPLIASGSRRPIDHARSRPAEAEAGAIEKIGLIGAGPIGCELAEAAGAMWGAEAILIDAAPNILPAMLDMEMARPVENYLRSEDVTIYTDCPLEGITETDDGLVIKTPKGEFEVDHAVIAVGVKPNTKLAADCGLEIGQGGGIVVDEKMATSDPDIFAAGDCAQLKHLVTGKPIQL